MTANKQQTDTMTNKELKLSIKSQMSQYKQQADDVRRTLKPTNPKYEQLKTVAEYFSAMSHYHATTLLLVLAHEKNRPYAELVEKRQSVALEVIMLMPILVEEGLMTENMYIQKCRSMKEDLEKLRD